MKHKSARTVLLGLFATATLVWSAVYHFSVPIEEMAWLFAYSVMGVLFIALLAGAAVAVLQVGKSLRNKDSAPTTVQAPTPGKKLEDEP